MHPQEVNTLRSQLGDRLNVEVDAAPTVDLNRVLEATVRTGHGTTDWFQIETGVHQGCFVTLLI